MSDVLEAAANAVLGMVISWTATWAVLGYSPAQSVGVVLMFTGLSFTRSYVLRRIFRAIA